MLLKVVEDHGWSVTHRKGGNYYKCLCPCGEHKETVHSTPSDPHYALNKRKQFERAECWEKE